MSLKQIAYREDFQKSQMIEISLEGKKILLLEHEGQVHAYQGECPHEGAALVQGHIENGHIVCPLHHRSFSCKTGKHNLSSMCLKRYTVTEKEGAILVNTDEIALKKEEHNGVRAVKDIHTLPSPKGDFIIGHVKKFSVDDRHILLEKWAKEEGNLFKLNFLGKKIIVSADNNINKQLLKSRPESFRRYYKINEVMEEMGILGTFNAEGETWERHRKIIAEALNVKNIRGYFPTIALITDRLLHRWTKLSEEGLNIDVQKEFMRYTVDITTTIAFGYDTNTLEKDDDIIQNHLEKVFPMVTYRMVAPIPIWRFIKSRKDKEFDLSLAEVKKTVNRFISEARERLDKQPVLRENPTNFLEALLVQQQTEGNFSDKEILGNVFTILLAGEDTTSNSLSWILYYLSLHPDMMQKVRNEADKVFSGKAVPDSFNLINELKYAEAVAQEVIRLKPVTPVIFLEALEDVVVNDLSLKKGTVVLLQNKVAQTDEKNFAYPERFTPERWIAGKCPFTGAHHPEVIQTFGNGPRFCPGKNLAMVEMITATSMICKNFDFELAVPKETIKEIFAFTMFPENLLLTLKKREESAQAVTSKEKVNY